MAISINTESVPRDVVVIGASAGATSAVTELPSRLPEDLQACIGVVIHRGERAPPPTNPNIAKTAALHGHDLLALGFTVDEVVHDYGDVCQAVAELVVEQKVEISAADFHALNRCLDNAFAAAVTTWSDDRESDIAETASGTTSDLCDVARREDRHRRSLRDQARTTAGRDARPARRDTSVSGIPRNARNQGAPPDGR